MKFDPSWPWENIKNTVKIFVDWMNEILREDNSLAGIDCSPLWKVPCMFCFCYLTMKQQSLQTFEPMVRTTWKPIILNKLWQLCLWLNKTWQKFSLICKWIDYRILEIIENLVYLNGHLKMTSFFFGEVLGRELKW